MSEHIHSTSLVRQVQPVYYIVSIATCKQIAEPRSHKRRWLHHIWRSHRIGPATSIAGAAWADIDVELVILWLGALGDTGHLPPSNCADQAAEWSIQTERPRLRDGQEHHRRTQQRQIAHKGVHLDDLLHAVDG